MADTKSGAAWREWFDRLGEAASTDAVNATAGLVIAECEIHAAPLMHTIDRLLAHESALLCAIEDACHAWNKTPTDYRSPLMDDAINKLSDAHQEVMRDHST